MSAGRKWYITLKEFGYFGFYASMVNIGHTDFETAVLVLLVGVIIKLRLLSASSNSRAILASLGHSSAIHDLAVSAGAPSDEARKQMEENQAKLSSAKDEEKTIIYGSSISAFITLVAWALAS
jgi:hypothetical protein